MIKAIANVQPRYLLDPALWGWKKENGPDGP
jgi:hypothetical protein